MTDWKQELRRTWALQRKPPDDTTVRAHVLAHLPTGELRLYTDHVGGRHLLVPGSSSGQMDAAQGDALRCEVRILTFEGTVGRFLDISCRQASLFEVFDDLLVSVVNDAVASGDPLSAACDVITRWRELLRAWSTTMSDEREMGLFAELAVVDIITATSGVFRSGTWRGPLREPKDVVLDQAWVEVKAAGLRTESVWINGLEQLADLIGLDGYLAIATLSEDESGETVDDVARRLRSRAEDPDEFDELLLAAGWTADRSGSHWVLDHVDVADAVTCPRLIEDSANPVPLGVGRVRYELQLHVVRSLCHRNGRSVLSSLGARR